MPGSGFMVEYDLQLFSRRSKYWENNLGDARYHQEQLAQAMSLWPNRPHSLVGRVQLFCRT